MSALQLGLGREKPGGSLLRWGLLQHGRLHAVLLGELMVGGVGRLHWRHGQMLWLLQLLLLRELLLRWLLQALRGWLQQLLRRILLLLLLRLQLLLRVCLRGI